MNNTNNCHEDHTTSDCKSCGFKSGQVLSIKLILNDKERNIDIKTENIKKFFLNLFFVIIILNSLYFGYLSK